MTIWHNGIEIDSRNKLIRHRGVALQFDNWRPNAKKRSVRFLLIKHLILGFHDTVELFDLLYGDQEDGGPVAGPQCIVILFHYARKDIDKLRLRLVKQRNCRSLTQYHLEPIGDDT